MIVKNYLPPDDKTLTVNILRNTFPIHRELAKIEQTRKRRENTKKPEENWICGIFLFKTERTSDPKALYLILKNINDRQSSLINTHEFKREQPSE